MSKKNNDQIGFQQIGLGGVLRQYRLVVPANQREFSWSDKEVTTLLTDFAKAISDERGEYFLGTIVTIPRTLNSLEVVDGQQRLATTAILLTTIRNFLSQSEKLISESITNDFLTDIDRDKRERVAKMQLNVDDNEYFRTLITTVTPLPTPTKSSHQLIKAAYEICSKQVRSIVSGFDSKDHGDVLNKWINFVEHNASVILLKVPSDVNAYKMFETLNDRGLKTSQADLIKNYLFGESGLRITEAQQKWALIKGALESLDEDDIMLTFLRHALIAIRGALREPEVYEALQERAKGSQASIELLNSLESLANLYVATLNAEHQKWNSYPDAIRKAIKTLIMLNIRPIRPLLLAISAKFDQNEASAAYNTLISCAVRLLIASSTRSGSIENAFASTANDVYTGTIANNRDLKKRLTSIIPNDEQFRQAFETATVSKANLARYYLRSLEMAAKDDPTPWFIPNDDRETINLEHVLPESPEGNWPQFNKEQVIAYYKRIGNLALMLAKNNSDAKSVNFTTKKPLYNNTPYALTNMISSCSDWTEITIIERQKHLAALALKAWPI